jgi:hypothetical protein
VTVKLSSTRNSAAISAIGLRQTEGRLFAFSSWLRLFFAIRLLVWVNLSRSGLSSPAAGLEELLKNTVWSIK